MVLLYFALQIQPGEAVSNPLVYSTSKNVFHNLDILSSTNTDVTCPCDVRRQLLNLVVRKERPDLADLGEQLVEQQNGFKIKMKELEDNILYKLATAEGELTPIVLKSLALQKVSVLCTALGTLPFTHPARQELKTG